MHVAVQTIDLAVEGKQAFGASELVADVEGRSPDGISVGVILHGREGQLAELEVYPIDEIQGPFALPSPSTLVPLNDAPEGARSALRNVCTRHPLNESVMAIFQQLRKAGIVSPQTFRIADLFIQGGIAVSAAPTLLRMVWTSGVIARGHNNNCQVVLRGRSRKASSSLRQFPR